VDTRNDIREFLISRRAKISPDRAGLPAYGARRRVTGLRREEVAMLAGISVEYYTRLERGNASGVSEDVLEGIAGALQLDEAERAPPVRPGPRRQPGSPDPQPPQPGAGPANSPAHPRRHGGPPRLRP
jgi:hypothetical protein